MQSLYLRFSILYLLTCFECLFSLNVQCQTLQAIESKRILLPNQWGITPIGKSMPLGDLPLNIAVSRSEKLLAVTNNGQSDQSIMLFDVARQALLDSFPMAKSWLGLVFSRDGNSLFASGGNDNMIIRFDVSHLKLIPIDTIHLGSPWPTLISPAGIAYDDKKQKLYVVTKEDNALYVADLDATKKLTRYDLGAEGYTCLLSPDRKILYISCWGCDKIELFDTDIKMMAGSIPVGDNPNDMCQTKNGRFLFVANANDNSVSVIDVVTHHVIETLNAALFPDSPTGSTTNSLALSGDDKTLYIANADNNCLSVFNVSQPGKSISEGFIPTGWYPTCVRMIGDHLYVANGKGFSSMANPNGPSPRDKKQEVLYRQSGHKSDDVQYIGGLFRGTLSIIPIPDKTQLNIYSQVVYHNTPNSKKDSLELSAEAGNPIPQFVGGNCPIKHVFYIVKENRSYDQVLGDLPMGNGDPSLVLFGENITPNQHALVKEFVLMDNFYVDGEVSADGHNWSMGAYATDYLEKNWPTSYGDR
ncbi:MAG: beta-propeller fold lactonase family protein, partial [Saprospiraceae bacterium]